MKNSCARRLVCVLACALAIVLATSTGTVATPGALLQSELVAHAPPGATAHRIVYRSTGLRGEPITVSGIVVVPEQPSGAVVAWAHPTTGVAQHCAPSLRPNMFGSIPGLAALLARGLVVTATDYPGLGTEGTHPYLVGISEGRALLDSVRAARALVGPAAQHRFALWGHSQGGHAVLFAAQLRHSYAPELELVGVAAAAPATELAALFDKDIGTVNGRILTAMTLWSWSRVFGARLDDVVVPGAMAALDRLANHCVESIADVLGLRLAEHPLQGSFLKVDDLTKVSPWDRLMAENTPAPSTGGAPVFLAQGSADTVVDPGVTAAFGAALCRHGVPVTTLVMPGVIHAFAAYRSADAAAAWMADRFDGKRVPNDCR